LNELQYERERIAFGDELRTLRKVRRIRGVDLSNQVGISQSKLSKIETGALIPSTDDLLHIFGVLTPSQPDVERLTDWARALRTEYVSWRFGHRKGFAAKQSEVAELERQTRRIRVFQVSAVPGLLQIPEYARRVMSLANVTHQSDLEKAVGLRMQRQQILFEPGREFEFLITESAAISRFCEPNVVTRQIDRLRFLFDLPNVKIGFIPRRTSLPRVPQHSFVVFDSSAAVFETLTGEILTIDERDVEVYNTAFDEFASVAVFGSDADPLLDECKQLLSMQVGSAVESAAQRHADLLER
jgi:transcriptional regulator with XRE-family HTH domain